ncbi:MAG: hypothetical protein NQU45_06540 [Methanothermobacter sp.]|nr:hypothetical protein [Methanothermobacter sp.]
MGYDPAVATGPLATILSDFTTTLIYLWLPHRSFEDIHPMISTAQKI